MEEALTRSIIAAFYDVYNGLGYGFLESIYMSALEHELRLRGHDVARELRVVIRYKGRPVGIQRLDMIVDDAVVVEGKSSERIPPSCVHQLVSYLKGSAKEVGLLLHFGPSPHFQRRVFRHRVSRV